MNQVRKEWKYILANSFTYYLLLLLLLLLSTNHRHYYLSSSSQHRMELLPLESEWKKEEWKRIQKLIIHKFLDKERRYKKFKEKSQQKE